MTDTGRDIGWAVSMMHKGGKVHRISEGEALALEHDVIVIVEGGDPWLPDQADVLATDWELAGE
jgi:hypothetical protein